MIKSAIAYALYDYYILNVYSLNTDQLSDNNCLINFYTKCYARNNMFGIQL